METKYIKLAQRLAGVNDDGIWGSKSKAAAKAKVQWVFDGRENDKRWITAVIQQELKRKYIEFGAYDAYWGPSTQHGADTLLGAAFLRPPTTEYKTIKCYTPSTTQLINKYGQVGTNQVLVETPYTLRLDWDLNTTVNKFSCHKLIADKVYKAMEETLKTYGRDKIIKLGLDRFGGCLNVRRMRGGSSWSTHAWGIAIDWYPDKNQLKWGKDRAVFARPEYAEFIKVWENQGAMNLGVCYDYDWMHFQFNP